MSLPNFSTSTETSHIPFNCIVDDLLYILSQRLEFPDDELSQEVLQKSKNELIDARRQYSDALKDSEKRDEESCDKWVEKLDKKVKKVWRELSVW
jgi:uncharacterized FlaG/YvyC family protein